MTEPSEPEYWDIDDIAAYLGVTRNAVWNAIVRAAQARPRTGARFPMPPDRPPGPTGRGRGWLPERIRAYAAARPGRGRWKATR